ncbi:cyclohexanecarboxylate-CoA ligase [Rhodopseudomonas pseudopalustris]|uniref:Cyclohexanecarboxylate-CoA ligase n=1 Tax=Rhodopseudomonas pseudopalustris TaxID=1513892 RepID=A0A1H8UKI0_9BRAD|nr:cyclohexanecarboxylate-CoA ligase [Rhodopseudomonas pseudopalustris]SEP03374.1 cyclohexanecarboxylate-CoA ligase [Rhodopseudomonas pseudopalustris]
MEFDAVLLPARRAESIARGFWHDRTINDDLDACVAACPDKTALTAVRLDGGQPRRFSYRELAMLADRVAVGLSRLGVARNDVVAMQLPNWWQFSILYLACSRIGAVLNPLMPIFRERELSFMLKHGEAKVLVVPKTFRNFDHEAMARGLQPSLPALQRIVVVDGGGADDFNALLTIPEWEQQPDAQKILSSNRPGPDDITQLIYTSGTTGEPKGVMHSANTLMANIIPYAERLRLGADDVILMASPMAHQTGFMYGLMLPIMLKASAVLQDVWDPAKAAELIRAEQVSFTMASTPFLTDLTRVVKESAQPVPSLKTFLCAGAPIPGPLVEQAQIGLGAKIVSAWGMTENGAVTLIKLDDDDRLASTTDGCALPGVEVRVVDGDGNALPAGQIGRLVVRACSNFGGYLKRPHWNATDAEGWFDTGDLAYMTAEGYIRISGRSKDVIIRGGENIPVVEVEALLYKHPAVAQVAIVAYPDERLGERACAVVVPRSGGAIDFPAMVEFLKSQKLAVQYIPERLIVREAMPATPSGKIQKFRLREMLQQNDL